MRLCLWAIALSEMQSYIKNCNFSQLFTDFLSKPYAEMKFAMKHGGFSRELGRGRCPAAFCCNSNQSGSIELFQRGACLRV